MMLRFQWKHDIDISGAAQRCTVGSSRYLGVLRMSATSPKWIDVSFLGGTFLMRKGGPKEMAQTCQEYVVSVCIVPCNQDRART
jgi:hypothetical protein